MRILILFFLVSLSAVVMTTNQTYDCKDIHSYHFHVYFFEHNPRCVKEAMKFRALTALKSNENESPHHRCGNLMMARGKATREQIRKGFLRACSLNEVMVGVDGPHPFSQYELCCNKSSFPQATAWHMQNHGNLSVLIHPLTVEDLDDHKSRTTWIGQPVPLDTEFPFLYPRLPKPRPCPVYPFYPDEVPTNQSKAELGYFKIPGTEDYQNKMGLNLLVDEY